MTVFTRTWDAAYEAQPADTENINLGATRIRNFKEDIQERVVVDHSFAGDENDGIHLKVTMPNSAVPTFPATMGGLYAVDDATSIDLYWRDEDGNTNTRITRNGGLNPTFAGAVSVGGLLTANALVVVGAAQFVNDPNIEISFSAPLVLFKVDTTSWMSYNRSTGVWQFVTNGVAVGSFGP